MGAGAVCRTGASLRTCGPCGAAEAAVSRRCHGSLCTSHDHPLAAAFLSAHCRNAESTVFAFAPYPPRAVSTAHPQPWLLVPGTAAIAMLGFNQYCVPFQTLELPPVLLVL